MCNSNRAENSRNNRERCRGCGGQITEDGDTYRHCVVCGLPVISLGYDTGYTYPSEVQTGSCLLYTSPSPRDATLSRMPSSA